MVDDDFYIYNRYTDDSCIIKPEEPSDWKMRHGNITYRPSKGNEPNWFHRWMQRIAFGFKWERR